MKPPVEIRRSGSTFIVLVAVKDRYVKQFTERHVDAALEHFCREYRWAAKKEAV